MKWWVPLAIGGSVAGALFGIPPLGLPGLVGGAGAAAGAAGAGAAAAGVGSAAGGLSIGQMLAMAGIGSGVNAATSIYSAKKQGSAAEKAAALQVTAANHAADLQAKAAQNALVFQQQQDAARQAEFRSVQDRNKALYDEAQARMTPYRNLGLGAMMQLKQPVQQPPSLWPRMGA